MITDKNEFSNLMTKIYRHGATGALLDEYEKAITELQQLISDISDIELIKIIDDNTNDSNCKSIQTILAHVVCSGFCYAMDIRQFLGEKVEYPDDLLRFTIKEYNIDLNRFLAFTIETFRTIQDNQLEEFDNNKKIATPWGQVYDIEQMTEHAIVHVLRHRRQIEKFKIILKKSL
ncbi:MULTISPECIES: DinB family protein [Flavobacterium]|uniref:Damage-inducible protein DinB n=1 Tax=Flavobacterium salmonis TaxID=2654844 RepID=A0A6V6Z541_9FLAO|nr:MULTISPECIES: DinB family protein [Flavobacterium]CAD0006908.1 damage-inducible protein DinB [Flavobacterium salmonis]